MSKIGNLFSIFLPIAGIICNYPIRTILVLYLLQVILAVAWPPIQLFGLNRLRDFLAFNVFSSIGPQSNHQLAGVLTYFKQHIAYLAFLWYFFLLRLRLTDKGEIFIELKKRKNWGSFGVRLLLVLCVLLIWSYRYILNTGFEEPLWGPVGKGLFSGFYIFCQDPISNFQYIFVFLYRLLEVGGILLLGLVAAATLPMFFILGRERKLINTEHKYANATIGRVLYLSVPFVAIVLIAILLNISRETMIGEISGYNLLIWFILFALIALGIYTLYDAWLSIGGPDLPSEERLGKMFKLIIIPLIVIFLYGGLTYEPIKSYQLDPIHIAKTMETIIINDYGEIFKWDLNKRETFRNRLRELVEKNFNENYLHDDHCYPMTLAAVKNLTPSKVRYIRFICLQSQVAIIYALDLLPDVLGDNWRAHFVEELDIKDSTNIDFLNTYVKMPYDHRRALTESYIKLDAFKKLGFLSKGTINAIHKINSIDWVTLNPESIKVYKDIESELRSEFDPFIGK